MKATYDKTIGKVTKKNWMSCFGDDEICIL